jgi:PAS domain S-box-containing protein
MSIRQLTTAAAIIGGGDLSHRVKVKSGDEIGQLGSEFNRMAERLTNTLVSRDELAKEVAERKKTEEALRQSEKKYHNLFQNAAVGMYRSKLDGSAILAVNKKLCEIFGYSEEEMLENPATIRWDNMKARSRMVTELNKSGSLYDYEMDIVAKGGQIRTCSVYVKLYPEQGYIEGSAIDITERKGIEKELRINNQAVESAQSGIAISDLAGNLIYVNPAFLKIWDYDQKQEVLGKPAVKFWQMEEKAAMVVQVLQEGKTWLGEMNARRKDGALLIVEVGASTVVDPSGQQIGFMASFTDITERKHTEEVIARSNMELQQFAQIISHDLQEPLRTISSYLQLLERRYKDKLDKDADEFIGFAVEGSKRMQDMIGGLLEYSRVETRGKQFVPVKCEDVLQSVIDNLQMTISDSGAQVTHDVLPVVNGDFNQLAQLFQNLIINGIKFRGLEQPHLHISALFKDREWVFSIRDNGIGIESKYFDRLFRIFQRLHFREEYPGTGMGLAICKRIVERHGGRIWLESESGKGSTFYFAIPIKGEE